MSSLFSMPQNEIRLGAADFSGFGSPVELGVFNANEVPLITGVVPTLEDGSFKGSIPCSPGLWYRRGVKDAGGQFVVEPVNFGVGEVIPLLGQSNVSRMFGWGTPASAPYYVMAFNNNLFDQGQLEQWHPPQGLGVCAMANEIASQKPHVPLGIVNLGRDGSSIAQWVNGQGMSASDPWGRFSTYMAGRDFRFAVWIQGETDVGLGTSYADYKAMLGLLYKRLLAFTGRTSSTLKLIVVQTGAVSTNVIAGATPARLQAIQQAQADFISSTPEVVGGGSMVGLATVDGTHLDFAAYGTGALGTCLGQVIAGQM